MLFQIVFCRQERKLKIIVPFFSRAANIKNHRFPKKNHDFGEITNFRFNDFLCKNTKKTTNNQC